MTRTISRKRKRLTAAVMVLVGAFFFAPGVGRCESTPSYRYIPSGDQNLTPMTAADGVLYVTGESRLQAWHLQTDNKLWSAPLPGAAHFRPRLSAKKVIAAGRSFLGAWDRQTGARLWHYSGRAEIGVPLVLGDGVYFGDGEYLMALSLEDGTERWRRRTSGGATIRYAPAGDDDIVYLGAGDGSLRAFDAVSGRQIWTVDYEKDWQYLRQLQTVGETLVGGGYKDEIYGLDRADGGLVWRFYAGNFINSQRVHEGRVVFWSPTGWIYALEVKTGRRLWRRRTHHYERRKPERWAPVLAEIKARGSLLYVLDMGRRLHVLNAGDGREIADLDLPFVPRPFITLATAPDLLLFADLQGRIVKVRFRPERPNIDRPQD